MDDKLLTRTEVAGLLGIREENVLRMAQHGVLPQPVIIDDEPHFPEEPIMRLREEEDEDPCSGVSLESSEGVFYYRVVKASHVVTRNRWPFAVFALWDGSLHIRPWLTHVVGDLPDHEDILLSCQNQFVPEIRLEDLPEPTSITWAYAWVGQCDLDDSASRQDAEPA